MRKVTALIAAAAMTAALFTGSTVQAGDFSYADLSNTSFSFSSGVGAWGTGMEISSDGTFSGNYHDTDAGSSGDGYNGTVYYSDFRGKLGELTKISENVYEAQITKFQIKNEKDSSEIKDGMLYKYTLPYGLLDADGEKPASKLTFYLKGTDVSTLPESFSMWALSYTYNNKTILEECCIHNSEADHWFIGYAKEETSGEAGSDSSSASTSYPEPWNTKLQNALQREEQLKASYQSSQSGNDRFSISSQLYLDVWDALLNEIWQSYSEGTKDQLRPSEIDWINRKDSEVASYSDQAEGYMRGAELTKQQVYVLLQYVN
ncbi:MAG: hypothetical protein Q4B26_08280 [Eubacteriales bacterium]|nr:hypothetical protein [Eubacteriales bacterium]